MKKLLKALIQMEEQDLTSNVIIPLLEKVHPGRVEYTHSPIEAGRDIVSFGKDSLKRQHILCVQIKANKVTYGAQFQGIVVNPSKMAKMEGVTTENGTQCIPHEIWYITSSPFPEQERRQISGTLKDLEKNNIKFIAGEELCDIVSDNLPVLAQELCKYANKEVVDLISFLSKHTEGIAFEMDFERNINEFYVTASFSPNFNSYYLSDEFENLVLDFNNKYACNITDNLLDDKEVCSHIIEKTLIDRERSKVNNTKLHKIFDINYDIKILAFYEKEKGHKPIILSTKDICKKFKTIKNLKNVYITFHKTVYLNKFFRKISDETKVQISKCPKNLTKTPESIIKTNHLIRNLETFINLTKGEYKNINILQGQYFPNNPIELRIQIKKPEYVLGLGANIIVEGQPGCGKTTLLRKIAVSLLEKNKNIKYVNCCSISSSFANKSLEKIVNKFAVGKSHSKTENIQSVLIIDGLDESPFDISNKIIKDCHKFMFVICSSRTAYNSSVRNIFFNILLDPFSKEERDLFFYNIFRDDKIKFETCQNIFSCYTDIDQHTRIPLIASITATLIRNGYNPTTRSEIYNYRLELLLSKWDRVRGVSRIIIDNPKAKIRFLKDLAFRMHSFETRNRFIETCDLRDTYEDSLGSWGYEFDFETFVEDLVVGNGVLIKTGDNSYSFGHLSFQEHLAGEYLAEKSSLKSILGLLGNDWWREPLNFWASNRGSITDILDLLLEAGEYHYYTEQLLEMTKYAPYTSAAIVEILKEEKFENELQ